MTNTKNIHIIIFIIIFCMSFQRVYASDDIHTKYPIGICIIPELEYITEIDDWSIQNRKIDSYDSLKAITSLKKYIPWAQNFIAPELVRSISRYAHKEMASYIDKPSLDSISFSLSRISGDGFKILLEGTADTLPSHSNIVTRWLKVYFVYNIPTNSIIRIIITIRGQLLE